MFLNSQLSIIPSKNLISNIGIGAETTHSTDSVDKLPKRIRPLFFMKTHQLDFPLNHPKHIIDDIEYRDDVHNILGSNISFAERKKRFIENKIRQIARKMNIQIGL